MSDSSHHHLLLPEPEPDERPELPELLEDEPPEDEPPDREPPDEKPPDRPDDELLDLDELLELPEDELLCEPELLELLDELSDDGLETDVDDEEDELLLDDVVVELLVLLSCDEDPVDEVLCDCEVSFDAPVDVLRVEV